MMTKTVVACLLTVGYIDGFAFVAPTKMASSTQLQMGLFDGVKEAFSAPALERSALASDRETPIDRWMGWSVTSENEEAQSAGELLVFVCATALLSE